ncbi:hypothetical protein ACFL2V_20360 [Pseudomonadota bacterium]
MDIIKDKLQRNWEQLSGKRAILTIGDEDIKKEIKKSVKKIVKGNGHSVMKETCEICRLMRSKNIIDGIDDEC